MIEVSSTQSVVNQWIKVKFIGFKHIASSDTILANFRPVDGGDDVTTYMGTTSRLNLDTYNQLRAASGLAPVSPDSKIFLPEIGEDLGELDKIIEAFCVQRGKYINVRHMRAIGEQFENESVAGDDGGDEIPF